VFQPGFAPDAGVDESERDSDLATVITSEDLPSLIGMELSVCFEQESHFYVWPMGPGPEGIVEEVKKVNPNGRLPFTAPYRSGVMLHNSFHVCTSTGLETFALQSARPILRQYMKAVFPRLVCIFLCHESMFFPFFSFLDNIINLVQILMFNPSQFPVNSQF
jgi:hypothetical protein